MGLLGPGGQTSPCSKSWTGSGYAPSCLATLHWLYQDAFACRPVRAVQAGRQFHGQINQALHLIEMFVSHPSPCVPVPISSPCDSTAHMEGQGRPACMKAIKKPQHAAAPSGQQLALTLVLMQRRLCGDAGQARPGSVQHVIQGRRLLYNNIFPKHKVCACLASLPLTHASRAARSHRPLTGAGLAA